MNLNNFRKIVIHYSMAPVDNRDETRWLSWDKIVDLENTLVGGNHVFGRYRFLYAIRSSSWAIIFKATPHAWHIVGQPNCGTSLYGGKPIKISCFRFTISFHDAQSNFVRFGQRCHSKVQSK